MKFTPILTLLAGSTTVVSGLISNLGLICKSQSILRSPTQNRRVPRHISMTSDKDLEARLLAMETRLQELLKQTQGGTAAPSSSSMAEIRAETTNVLESAMRQRQEIMNQVRQELGTAFQAQANGVKAATMGGATTLIAPAPVAVAVKPDAVAVGEHTNTAYKAKFARKGWSSRWGDEESNRVSGSTATSVAEVKEFAPADANAAYAARLKRKGWEDRWGSEETARLGSASVGEALEVPKHPAYEARLNRGGWSDRWGSEEVVRASQVPLQAETVQTSVSSAAADSHTAALSGYMRTYMANALEERTKWMVKADTLTSKSGTLEQELESVRTYLREYMSSTLDERTRLRTQAEALSLEVTQLKAQQAQAALQASQST